MPRDEAGALVADRVVFRGRRERAPRDARRHAERGRALSLRERVYRARRIGLTFGRIYLRIKSNQLLERRVAPSDMTERWSRLHRDAAKSIYDAAVELRGLILKGCQFMGSRADVLPPEYVAKLSLLQDRVPAHPFHVVRACVERELGCPLDEVFEAFSESPIASASLAQVHEAVLRGGERVAVKVQYPEIAAVVRSDLQNLRTLFRAVGLVERDFDVMPLMNELATYVPLELDFVNEARNSEIVARFFEGRDDIGVPRVHHEYTTARLLVMDYVAGIKISDADALRSAGVDSDRVMQTLVEAYCEQILVKGFFHADPHPGNLIVQPGAGSQGGPRLVFVDFGLAKDLPAGFRKAMVDFAAALLTGKADGMARALVELGFETRTEDPESLAEIARVVLDVASRLRHQSFIDPDVAREAGDELPRLVRENPIVRIPSHVVLLGRVVGLLSGLGSTLDAKLDMLTTILPYVLGSRRDEPPAA